MFFAANTNQHLKFNCGAEEVAQQLIALVTLAEDLGSQNPHCISQLPVTPLQGDPKPFSQASQAPGMYVTHIHL